MPKLVTIELAGHGREWTLDGPSGPLRVLNLRERRADERLLLPHLPQVTGRVVVPLPGGSPLVPAVAAAGKRRGVVEVFELDTYEARLLAEKLAPLSRVEVVCDADVQPLPDAARDQAGILLLRANSDRILGFDVIERLDCVLPAGSAVAVLVPRKRRADFAHKLDDHVGKLREVASDRDAVVLAGVTRGRGEAWTARRCAFEATTAQDRVSLVSRPGVFCHGRPDAGGLALAESVTAAPGERVLDLGCGCGLTGLLLAAGMRRQAGAEPVRGSVVLVDSNARAVACALAAAEGNGLGFVRAELTDRYEPVPASFDLVVTNPPYFADHRICEFFVTVAGRALRPGGRVVLVSKHGGFVRDLLVARGYAVEEGRRRGYDITRGVKRP